MYTNYSKPPIRPRLTVSEVISMLNEAADEAKTHLDDYLRNGYITLAEHQARSTVVEFMKLKTQDKLYEFNKNLRPKNSKPTLTTVRSK